MNLNSHGLSVRTPPGFDVRIYRRAAESGASTQPIMHASTLRLPANRGDYGSNVVDHLGPNDVFVALLEFDAGAASTALFQDRGWPRVAPSGFSPNALQRTLPGQSGLQRFFHVGSRAFCLYAVLGAHSRRLFLAPRVAELVRSVRVEAR